MGKIGTSFTLGKSSFSVKRVRRTYPWQQLFHSRHMGWDQTSADKDSESPDSSVSSLSGRTDRQRAAFFL